MKKILLGGTAMVAAALLAAAAPANAADPQNVTSGLSLKISGFIAAQAALILDSSGTDDEENLDRDYDFGSTARLQFDVKNVTDSGLEYGGRIRMNTVNRKAGVTVDRTYVYVKSGFGTVTFGDAPSVAGDMGYIFAHDTAVSAMGFAGGFADNIDGRYDYGGGDFFSLDPTYHSGLGNDTRIKYTSPSFGGISFAVDFTPVVGGRAHAGNGSRADLQNGPGLVTNDGIVSNADGDVFFENVVGGGLWYDSTFGDTSVIVGGTATYGNGVSQSYDLEAYSLGAQLGSGGITGSVNWVLTSSGFAEGLTDKDFNTITGSLAYQLGAFEFGLGYAYTWAQKNNDLAGSFTERFGDLKDNHIVSGTVAYTLAPGLNTWVEVTWEQQNFRKERVDGVLVNDKNSVDNTVLMTGLFVSF
jgi:hypothetical protein